MFEPAHSIRQPLRLRIGFSYCLLSLFCLMHIGAIFCVFLAILPGWLQAVFSLFILWHLNQTLCTHIFWQNRSIPQTFVIHNQQLYLDDENLASIENSYVQHFWILIRVRLPNGHKEHVLICADSISADEFRRLRIRLKYPQTRT